MEPATQNTQREDAGEVDLSRVPEYLTNIIYNQNQPLDCESLFEVPMKKEIELPSGWVEKLWMPNKDKIVGVEPSSVACCIIQLLHLLSFQYPPTIYLSSRNILGMKLLLQNIIKPAATYNETLHHKSFHRGEFVSEEESVSYKVLKVLVQQKRDGSGYVRQQIRLSDRSPIAVFHRFLSIMEMMVGMLPDKRIGHTSYHNIFSQFLIKKDELTVGAGLQLFKQNVETKTRLMRDYSLYTSMKEISFWNKVTNVDPAIEIYENQIEAIINSKITKVGYSSENELAKLSETINRQSEPHFVFYFKMHPTDERRSILTYIEIEHRNIPAEEGPTLDQFLSFLSQDKVTGIVTRCSSSSTTHQYYQAGEEQTSEPSCNLRWYSSKYLGSRNGQRLSERDLLRTFGELCMRGIILRIRLNAVLCNQFTYDEHRSEVINYFNMIRRHTAAMNLPRDHVYARDLQTFP